MAIHTPSAGVPEAERGVQFSVRTTRERLLMFISNVCDVRDFFLFFCACSCLTSRKCMPGRGLTPTISTNCSRWRQLIHMPYAGNPKTGRSAHYWPHTARDSQLKAHFDVAFFDVDHFFVVASGVTRPKRVSEKGFRPTIPTNSRQWREVIHMPSAGDPKTVRSAPCWPHTSQNHIPKASVSCNNNREGHFFLTDKNNSR